MNIVLAGTLFFSLAPTDLFQYLIAPRNTGRKSPSIPLCAEMGTDDCEKVCSQTADLT